MANLSIHRATVTWDNFDVPEVEQVLVFKIDGKNECAMRTNGMEICPDMVEIQINPNAIYAYFSQSEEAIEDFIHDLYCGDNDKILNALWEN